MRWYRETPASRHRRLRRWSFSVVKRVDSVTMFSASQSFWPGHLLRDFGFFARPIAVRNASVLHSVFTTIPPFRYTVDSTRFLLFLQQFPTKFDGNRPGGGDKSRLAPGFPLPRWGREDGAVLERAPSSFRSDSRKKILFCVRFIGQCFRGSSATLVGWWGFGSMGGPLQRAHPCTWRPGAGTVTRSAGPTLSTCARRLGPAVKAAPCGAAILQHDFYTPSALGVDVPPGGWLQPGSRGDSLRGLVHTSPLRQPPRRPGTR